MKIPLDDATVWLQASELDWRIYLLAERHGCSAMALYNRLRRYARENDLALPAILWGPARAHAVNVRSDEIERLEAKVDELLALVRARPTVVEWRPDHRRLRDGGRRVKQQRKEIGA